jgi:acetyl-CoA carboxylase carboxyltransferase component
MSGPVDALLAEQVRVRTEMGGLGKVTRLHDDGRSTVRDRIERLVDPGTFREEGTFVRSAITADRHRTPGDGIVGGLAEITGRPVTVAGNDVTVKGGSTGLYGEHKLQRLYEQAVQLGNPFVLLGEAAGARVPDQLGSESLTLSPGGGLTWMARRTREIPVISVIMGRSFGDSSFIAALSDLVIQVDKTVLAVTSPRVIEVATSEQVTEEELGGQQVHESITGQIDLGVANETEAFASVQSFLSFLPSNALARPPRIADVPPILPDARLREIVPDDRRRAYDMRKLLQRLFDDGPVFELRRRQAQSVITCLARLGGWSVGVVASQPMRSAGALTPEACDKMTRFICLCDAFNVPLIFLADSPGFLVGVRAEHDRLLFRSMLLAQALAKASVPRITVIIRKAFGLSLYALSGSGTGTVALYAWPTAEIGFMDPDVGANVLYAPELSKLPADQRAQEMATRASQLAAATSPFGAAAHMGIDEILDPAETGVVIRNLLDRLEGTANRPVGQGALRTWPTCW